MSWSMATSLFMLLQRIHKVLIVQIRQILKGMGVVIRSLASFCRLFRPHPRPFARVLQRIVDINTSLTHGCTTLIVALVEVCQVERLEDDDAEHDTQDNQISSKALLISSSAK